MIASGTEIPFRSMAAITRESLRAYAGASGDMNRIHLEDEVAREVGLPGVIAHGMLVAGHLAGRALQYSEEITARPWRVKKFNSRFRAMVFPGEVIVCGGVVRSAGEGELVLDLQARNPRGEITTTGSVVLVPETL